MRTRFPSFTSSAWRWCLTMVSRRWNFRGKVSVLEPDAADIVASGNLEATNGCHFPTYSVLLAPGTKLRFIKAVRPLRAAQTFFTELLIP